MNKYHPGETVNINIKSLINILQENNWVITTKKKGNGKLPLFSGNREQIITIYGLMMKEKDKIVLMNNKKTIM